jgi:uncharacterized membrane protein YqiK
MFATILWTAVGLAVVAGICWAIFVAVYVKTPPNMAFIRTGLFGRKVVVDGGAVVLFQVHELRWVSLETMKLELLKSNREAFITKDRFRMDIGIQFYVRVLPDEASIERASRSLGELLLQPEGLRRLLEEKLVAAIRAITAEKTLVQLHENREAFARDIANAVTSLIEQNGLSLESVSIFHLDQTRKDMLDSDNVFDAVGLKQIAAVTANEARERNDIERNNEVAITKKNVEAHRLQLDLELAKEKATTEQRKNVETDRIARHAETEQFRIAQDELIRRREIERDQQVREAELAREVYLTKKQEERDKADIEREMTVQAMRITRDRDVRVTEIERQQAVELTRRDMEIQLREKERAREEAEAHRLEAEALRERAAQQVKTVAQQMEAERAKLVALIEASRAEEVAEHESRARERVAAAIQAEGEAQAAARRQINEADNLREQKLLYYEIARLLAERAPEVLRELMEPARHIESIRILDLAGADGLSAGKDGAGPSGVWTNVAGQIVGAGMAMPLLRELLEFTKGKDGGQLPALLRRFPGLESLIEEGGKAEGGTESAAASTAELPRKSPGKTA